MTDLTPPDSKPFWQSKTFWAGLVTAVAPFVPGVAPFIAANPTLVTTGLGAIFLLLRVVTKGRVTVS